MLHSLYFLGLITCGQSASYSFNEYKHSCMRGLFTPQTYNSNVNHPCSSHKASKYLNNSPHHQSPPTLPETGKRKQSSRSSSRQWEQPFSNENSQLPGIKSAIRGITAHRKTTQLINHKEIKRSHFSIFFPLFIHSCEATQNQTELQTHQMTLRISP